MPGFYNCNNGILATNGSQVRIDKKTNFFNTTNVALGVAENSILQAINASGSSAAAGSTININNSAFGVQLSASTAIVQGAQIQNSRVGFGAFKGSKFNFDYSVVVGQGITNAQNYGVLADEGSFGTVYGTSVSGHTGGTGSGTGGNYKTTNGSVVLVGSSTQSNQTNTQGLYAGIVAIDPNLGSRNVFYPYVSTLFDI